MIFSPNDEVMTLGKDLDIGNQYNDILHNYFTNLGHRGSLPDQLRKVGPSATSLLEVATIMSDKEGALYDPSNITSLNQLAIGTTPVTAVTNPVGLTLDTRFGLAASTKGAYLSGAIGTYLSSPDSVPASITGDIDIRCKVMMRDWSPALTSYCVSKWLSTGGQQSYILGISGAGLDRMVLYQSTTGANAQLFTSTAGVGFTDGSTHHIRVTLDVDNGAAGRTATFYTSEDGVTWTQLGNTVVVAGATTTFDGTAGVNVSGINAGAEQVTNGKIYEAQIYNGINGTLVVNFKGTDYVTGTTLTSSTTGEVWTLNGAAYIAPDGNHAIQATAAARPTWQVDAGGYYYLNLLGIDDSLTSATGGGGSAGFFWCGVIEPTGGAGTLRTIWADNGTNTGYKIQLDTNNKLSFSAGNNTAFTTKASTATLTTKSMVTVWDDGTNLNVQINSVAAETVARPVVVAGTAGFTIGKDNGAASSFAIVNLYPDVYLKNTGLTAAQRASVQAWVRSKAGM